MEKIVDTEGESVKKELKSVITATLLCAALILLLMLLFPSPPSADEEVKQEQTVINLVYAYQNNQWSACIEEVIRRFENANPHIDVQYKIHYEDRVYEDMLYKLAARGEKVDVMQIKEPYAWAESGLIAELPDTLSRQVSTTCTVGDKTYGVCALGTTTGVVYNKAVFAQLGLSVPETYEEFLDICQTLKQNGVIPLGVGGKDLWHFEYWLNHFLRADILSKEPDFLAQCSAGERDWNDPLITDLLTCLNDLFRLGYTDESWPSTPDGALAFHMAEGQVAMVFSGPWLASEALNIDPTLELGWFYVPNTAGQIVAGDSLDVFWTISKDCAQDEARYEAAVALLEFFYSEGVYEDVYTAMAGFSTLTDTSRDQSSADGVLAEIGLAHETADQRIRGYVGDENTPPGFEKKLLILLSRMCAGELTVTETQVLASRYWDECLRQEVSYEN